MRGNQKTIKILLDEYIENSDNEDFSSSLKKWKGLILSLSRKGAKRLNISEEDFFQDLITALVFANNYHCMSLYRYNKGIYKKGAEFKDSVLLTDNKLYKTKKKAVLIPSEELEKVRKCKYDTFIYRRLIQEYKNIMSKVFTQKNGYEFVVQDGKVKSRSGNTTEMVDRKVKKLCGSIQVVSWDCLCDQKSIYTTTPEDLLMVKEAFPGWEYR